MDGHDLVSFSAWEDSRDTFFGNQGQSLIDHLILPRALLQTTKISGTTLWNGKKLQLVLKNKVFDHIPVHRIEVQF